MRRLLIPIFFTSALALAACSSYKLDIPQGNMLDRDDLANLKVGMNKQQVHFVLGTPVLETPFHSNRWTYVYMIVPGNRERKKENLVLYFEGDILVKMDDSGVLDTPPFEVLN